MTSELAAQFARSTLGHVGREYPHGLGHVVKGAGEDLTPSVLHPIFFGSYDWHSCVHGWWQLIRIQRLFPELDLGIPSRAEETFTPEAVQGEVAYLEQHPLFERPYGWAWLSALHSEAVQSGLSWATTLEPIARLIAGRFREYLPKLNYPVRYGVHSNTAFALVLANGWAEVHDPELARSIAAWVESRFGQDRAAPQVEPSGEDFLSPTLTEALLMARTATPERFNEWFGAYMPQLAPNLLQPAVVSDRTDGRIAHLDGLNLSRAWCWRNLALHRAAIAETATEAADRHLEAALPHLAEDYAGEHWLASFALLALTD